MSHGVGPHLPARSRGRVDHDALAVVDSWSSGRATLLLHLIAALDRPDAGVAARADRVVQMLDGRSVLATERGSPTTPMRGEPEPATLQETNDWGGPP